MCAKSTSGFYCELTTTEQDNDADPSGVPIAWGAKKQDSTSNHTCEADLVSLSSALRHEAIPLQLLLEQCLGIRVPIRIHEDNTAAITAALKGYTPAMRYLPRTQRIAVSFISEIINNEGNRIRIFHQQTATQKGDVFTKELGSADFWKAMKLLKYMPKAML